MTRVTLIDPANATGTIGQKLDQVKSAFGVVPNMFKAVANSPAALASMWNSFGALGSGRLGAKLGEQIAVAIADRNNCHYCLAAHTGLGRKAGATTEEMAEAQAGRSSDLRTAAALSFALKVVETRADVQASDVDALRAAGFDDEEVVEIIAHIALNLFTNYINVALDVPLDFPGVKLTRAPPLSLISMADRLHPVRLSKRIKIMSQTFQLAPELAVSEWFNTSAPLSLRGLRGRPIFLHSFQVLCPGCVSDAIPQVKRIEKVFGHTDLQIIGLHTVFEHHAAMSPVTLKAFIDEYRLTSPVAVDHAADGSPIPMTMRLYGMRGTPSSVLIGRDGMIIHQVFGIEDDMALGARLALALSAPVPQIEGIGQKDIAEACDSRRCEVPHPLMGTGIST